MNFFNFFKLIYCIINKPVAYFWKIQLKKNFFSFFIFFFSNFVLFLILTLLHSWLDWAMTFQDLHTHAQFARSYKSRWERTFKFVVNVKIYYLCYSVPSITLIATLLGNIDKSSLASPVDLPKSPSSSTFSPLSNL